MKKLDARINVDNYEIKVTMTGDFDESAKLPYFQENKNIRINFGAVSSMNSYGVKLWCQWGEAHKDIPAILLVECPYVIAKHFKVVNGFLKPNMTVLSFYVPFYSDATGESKNVLFVREREYFKDGTLKIPEVKDSKGQPMQPDVMPQVYFGFLNLNANSL